MEKNGGVSVELSELSCGMSLEGCRPMMCVLCEEMSDCEVLPRSSVSAR